jgi:hypothetical protein
VLGTLINFTNMRRVNTRGMKNANKHVLMAALTYNLKKLLKFSREKVKIKAAEMRQRVEKAIFSFLTTLLHLQKPDISHSNFQTSKLVLKINPS